MSPQRREPDREHSPDTPGVAHEHVTPDPANAADWDEERMRGARPREIVLNPDGTRHADDPADETDPPEGEPEEQ